DAPAVDREDHVLGDLEVLHAGDEDAVAVGDDRVLTDLVALDDGAVARVVVAQEDADLRRAEEAVAADLERAVAAAQLQGRVSPAPARKVRGLLLEGRRADGQRA